MKKVIDVLKAIAVVIILCIPVLNAYFLIKREEQTLMRWTSHKDLLWVTNIDKIKVIYNHNGEYVTLYKGEFNIFTTCTDKENYSSLKHVWVTPIKYIRDYEDEHLVIQLWNTRKMNKLIEKGVVKYEEN